MMSTTPFDTSVSEAAESIDMTSLARVKLEMGFATAEHDELLARMITEQSATFAKECNRDFAKQTYVNYFERRCGEGAPDKLVLSQFPVSSVVTVVEDGETLMASDYRVTSKEGFLLRLSGGYLTCWSARLVTVTFVAGYELLGGLPYDIEPAIVEMVKRAWFARSRDPMIKGEEVPGILRTDYWVGAVAGDGSDPVAKAIANHRMPAI